MAASLQNLTVQEAQNASLGQAGAIVETSTTAITGKSIVAFQMLEDTVFTALTPSDTTFRASTSNPESVSSRTAN